MTWLFFGSEPLFNNDTFHFWWLLFFVCFFIIYFLLVKGTLPKAMFVIISSKCSEPRLQEKT